MPEESSSSPDRPFALLATRRHGPKWTGRKDGVLRPRPLREGIRVVAGDAEVESNRAQAADAVAERHRAGDGDTVRSERKAADQAPVTAKLRGAAWPVFSQARCRHPVGVGHERRRHDRERGA